MGPSFHVQSFDWYERGYFIAPTPPEALRCDPEAPRWRTVQDILAELKAGDFHRVEELLEICEGTSSDLLRWSCAQILGDSGTKHCFHRMIQLLDDTLDASMAGMFCNALQTWGSLSAVPAIIQSYHRHFGFQDVEALPLLLSTLMEPEWGPLAKLPTRDIDVYYDQVMERYEAFVQQFDTTEVLLLHGERFSVVSLAHRMLRNLGTSPYEKAMQPIYRRRFEASTGIDCSSFFKDREFQPLTAAALLERFLESPEAARYKDGVRYFFGHRIPE